MDFIIPLNKLVKALNSGLYDVIKEAFLIGEHTINKGGKVIIQSGEGKTPEVIKIFAHTEDFYKWLNELLDSYSQWNIQE